MRRAFAISISAALIAVPLIASAQSNVLTSLISQALELKEKVSNAAQVAAPSLQDPGALYREGLKLCIPPARTLRFGDHGDDVVNLQIFLARHSWVLPETSVTGFYGGQTQAAVGKFQKGVGLVSGGSPATTGLGRVGNRTLAVMRDVWDCGGDITVGWFRYSSVRGLSNTVLVSAQTASTHPLGVPVWVDFGDGVTAIMSVSSTICNNLTGPCTSVLSVQHTYARGGTYKASMQSYAHDHSCYVIPQVCPLGAGLCSSIPPQCFKPKIVITTATADIIAGVDTPDPPKVVSAPLLPSIAFSTSIAGASTNSILPISWTSANAPSGASVTLRLLREGGGSVGVIQSRLPLSGTFRFRIQGAAPKNCSANPDACLAILAMQSCEGLCDIEPGKYSISAEMVTYGIITSVKSPSFEITDGSSAISDLLNFQLSSSSLEIPNTSTTPYIPDIIRTEATQCTYSGVQYPEGISLDVNCADVTSTGNLLYHTGSFTSQCGSYSSTHLTCHNGAWSDGSGTAVYVPGVSNTEGGVQCKTPWGNQMINSGQQISYEPFFTHGAYSGQSPIPLVQCSSGSWLKCNFDGTGCHPFIPF